MAITTNIDQGVAQITIQRPENRNSLDSMHCQELARQLSEADANPEVHAIVLTGLTNVFTAGLDIAELQIDAKGLVGAFDKLIETVDKLSKPVIAAVTGPAIAQGVALLYHCDMAYCGEHSMFSLPNLALGLPPQYGVSLLAVRSAGYKMAFRKIISSEPISPSEAVQMGFINAVLDDEKVIPQAVASGVRFASMPPETLKATKELLKAAYEKGMAKQVELENELFNELIDGPEHKEAVAAFLENRKPNFAKKDSE